MSASRETENYVNLLPRASDGRVDIFRIGGNRSQINHRTYSLATAEQLLDEKLMSEHRSLKESEIFLELNIATAAILFLEAIRQRSKGLAISAVIPLSGAVYANSRRINYWNEIKWIEKEAVAVENHLE